MVLAFGIIEILIGLIVTFTGLNLSPYGAIQQTVQHLYYVIGAILFGFGGTTVGIYIYGKRITERLDELTLMEEKMYKHPVTEDKLKDIITQLKAINSNTDAKITETNQENETIPVTNEQSVNECPKEKLQPGIRNGRRFVWSLDEPNKLYCPYCYHLIKSETSSTCENCGQSIML